MAKNINIKELIILIFSIVIFIFAIFNFNIVINIFSYIIAILFPLFLGLLIAFILNIPMKFVEKQLNSNTRNICFNQNINRKYSFLWSKNKRNYKRIKRTISKYKFNYTKKRWQNYKWYHIRNAKHCKFFITNC